MTYALVACPSCKTPKGVEVGGETTVCNGCGKRLSLGRLRKIATSDSIEGLQAALGEWNARRAGEDGVPVLRDSAASRANRPPSDLEAAFSRIPRSGGQAFRAEAVAKALTEARGTFDEAAFADALDAIGLQAKDAASHLRRLIDAGAVVSPSAGQYRSV